MKRELKLGLYHAEVIVGLYHADVIVPVVYPRTTFFLTGRASFSFSMFAVLMDLVSEVRSVGRSKFKLIGSNHCW
jgi:hypothetical protein